MKWSTTISTVCYVNLLTGPLIQSFNTSSKPNTKFYQIYDKTKQQICYKVITLQIMYSCNCCAKNSMQYTNNNYSIFRKTNANTELPESQQFVKYWTLQHHYPIQCQNLQLYSVSCELTRVKWCKTEPTWSCRTWQRNVWGSKTPLKSCHCSPSEANVRHCLACHKHKLHEALTLPPCWLCVRLLDT